MIQVKATIRNHTPTGNTGSVVSKLPERAHITDTPFGVARAFVAMELPNQTIS